MESIDLKKTVHLPRTDFPMKANLAQLEPKLLEQWDETGIYDRIREARKGQPTYILHDGPPYANGNIHLGHAFNKLLKDFIVKMKTMEGYDSPYVPGWDCHGLPIEIKVDSQLGSKKAGMSAAQIRAACRKYAEKYVDLQRKDFIRLGVLGRWQDPYLTMSAEYEAVIAGAFVDFLDQGYVYKGLKPVNWCIHDRTALAEAEVEYENHTSPSIWVRFALTSDPAAIDPALAGKKVWGLIWTTTPWTIPANLAICFHPKFHVRSGRSRRRRLHRRQGFAERHGGSLRLGVAQSARGIRGRAAGRDRVPPSVSRARFGRHPGRSCDARTRHRRGAHGSGARPGRLRDRPRERSPGVLSGGWRGAFLSGGRRRGPESCPRNCSAKRSGKATRSSSIF